MDEVRLKGLRGASRRSLENFIDFWRVELASLYSKGFLFDWEYDIVEDGNIVRLRLDVIISPETVDHLEEMLKDEK